MRLLSELSGVAIITPDACARGENERTGLRNARACRHHTIGGGGGSAYLIAVTLPRTAAANQLQTVNRLLHRTTTTT
jgi:hypothetical protein